MKNMQINELMTGDVLSIDVTKSLKEAEWLMRKNNIRHIPVVKRGKLVGILSLTDLQRLSFAGNFGDIEGDIDVAVYNMLNIEQVMIANPVTINHTQTVKEATEILAEKGFHSLPVVNGEEVVGMLTTTDLLKYFLDCIDCD